MKPLEFRPFCGGARENPHKTATIWDATPEVRKISELSLTQSPYPSTVLPAPFPDTKPHAARKPAPTGPDPLATACALRLAAVGQVLGVFHGTRPGWIEVIAGVMFSGKSEELVRRVRRAGIARKHVQGFKSHLDARYAGLYTVSTHDGGTVEAEPVDSSEGVVRAVRPETEVVAVDEVQFLDDGIVAAANGLADRGVRIVLAGIDMDFRGLPFGPMPTLLAVAEIVDKLQAICVVCGGPASRNQRLVNGRPALWDSPTIMVGGRESYEARCRHCHKVPRKDEDQTALL